MVDNKKSKSMLVLGIETSCDDTGIALYDKQHGLLDHVIYNQTEIHKLYGGVVPELASRDHLLHIMPALAALLTRNNLSIKHLNAIAYTKGPGLAGALLVGATIGHTLAWANQIPVIGVHHLEGHVLAPMLEENRPDFPFVALIVSGGHTMLVAVRAPNQYLLLGETRDDAAGEAFDKTAKLLGLGYPGGAALAALAQHGKPHFTLPKPLCEKRNRHKVSLEFSFSGLKTAVKNLIMTNQQHIDRDSELRADIAYAFEDAVVDTLVAKTRQALLLTKYKRLVAVGGVAANCKLRDSLRNLASDLAVAVYLPRYEFCTDNGAMIAYAGCQRLLAGQQQDDLAIVIKPRWSLMDLSS